MMFDRDNNKNYPTNWNWCLIASCIVSICTFCTAHATGVDQRDMEVRDNVSIKINELMTEKGTLKKCQGKFPQFRKREPTGIKMRTFNIDGYINPNLCQDLPDAGSCQDREPIPATYKALVKGNPGDPIALLVHGFPGSADDMRYLLDDMAAAGYYAVAPYLRGYHPTISDLITDTSVMLDLVTSDLIEISNMLALETTSTENIYFGHDWGGLVGQPVMQETGSFFSKFVNMGVFPVGDPVINFVSLFSKFKYHQNLFYAAIHQIAPSTGGFNFDYVIDLGLTQEPVDWIGGLWKLWDPFTANSTDIEHAKNALLTDSSNEDLENALNYYRNFFIGSGLTGNFSQPALAIHGSLDKSASGFHTDPETVASIYSIANNPDNLFGKQGTPWEYVILDCAGHWPMIGQPDIFRDVIFDFLEL